VSLITIFFDAKKTVAKETIAVEKARLQCLRKTPVNKQEYLQYKTKKPAEMEGCEKFYARRSPRRPNRDFS